MTSSSSPLAEQDAGLQVRMYYIYVQGGSLP